MTTRHTATPLLERLVDPRLEGAACVGRAPLHDHEIDGEPAEDRMRRLDWAVRMCRGCPVQAACRTAVHEQDIPAGMWAGRMYETGPTGRRKETAA